ncbi:MAG: DUF2087 domain-containing protein [Actinomycetota bacterium]
MTLDARRLVGLLADPTRRRVVAALILGAGSAAEVADQTGLTMREVVDAMERLTTAGLVETLGDGNVLLLAQAFERAARAEAPAKADTAFPDETEERRRVLDTALRDGRLIQMPTKRSKRLILLDHLVQRFEPGERYSEKQVNAMLSSVDADVAALRRYLVDEAMLDRGDGEYWRIGGTYPVD